VYLVMEWVEGQLLRHISRLLGNTLLPDLTETAIRRYAKTRLDERASGRPINMELGELSRALGKKWSVLWPKVRKLEERKDVGSALSPEAEARLLEAAAGTRFSDSRNLLRVALLTRIRSSEISTLTWGQLDLAKRYIVVGRAKTSSGTRRQIPMNLDLFYVLSTHAQWYTGRFGDVHPGLYIFPFGKPVPSDLTRRTITMKTASGRLRKRAGVNCRLHDLRHTAATKMAEAGVPESTMLALMGHMGRAMLERYSRMAAKREAVEALSTRPKTAIPEQVSTISTTVLPAGPMQ
jgi:integrase